MESTSHLELLGKYNRDLARLKLYLDKRYQYVICEKWCTSVTITFVTILLETNDKGPGQLSNVENIP